MRNNNNLQNTGKYGFLFIYVSGFNHKYLKNTGVSHPDNIYLLPCLSTIGWLGISVMNLRFFKDCEKYQ
jgi:hypothetical protein